MSISLDQDHVRHFMGPDLGPNCLKRISADDVIACYKYRQFKMNWNQTTSYSMFQCYYGCEYTRPWFCQSMDLSGDFCIVEYAYVNPKMREQHLMIMTS